MESGQWRIPRRNRVYKLSLGEKARVIPVGGWSRGITGQSKQQLQKPSEEEDCELESVAHAE